MRLRGDTALVQVHARNLRILELVLGGQVQPQLLDHEVARVQKQQLVVGVVHFAQKVREYLTRTKASLIKPEKGFDDYRR